VIGSGRSPGVSTCCAITSGYLRTAHRARSSSSRSSLRHVLSGGGCVRAIRGIGGMTAGQLATRDVASVVLECPEPDRGIRWQPGERLEQLFEERCDMLPQHLAVDGGDETLTYRQLDVRANRLARYPRD